MPTFISQVTTTVSAMHANGSPGHKCENPHGHDWRIIVQFHYRPEDLDPYGWGPEFGAVKTCIRKYDHGVFGTLNEMLAPDKPSAENFAVQLAQDITTATGHTPEWVEVHEGDGNQVRYYP